MEAIEVTSVGTAAAVLAVALVFMVVKAVQGKASVQHAIHYLGSGIIGFLYFLVALPWIYWFTFEWLAQAKHVDMNNGVLEFLLRSSQTIGIIESFIALGVLAWTAWKKDLKVIFTAQILGAAAVAILFFGWFLPWILWISDAAVKPSGVGEVVHVSSITLAAISLAAAVAFVVVKAVQGRATPGNAIHYLGSGSIAFLYFMVALPWAYWVIFHWLPQPKAVDFDNVVLEFLMRSSQSVGIVENFVALGILVWYAWKKELKLVFTLQVFGAAVAVMLILGWALPWVARFADWVPMPS